MPPDIDDERYARLTGPYRTLWRAARRAEREAAAAAGEEAPAAEAEPPDPAHAAVRRQVEALLEDTDVSDAERRLILDSIACPCCGGSGASFAMTIKPAKKAGF